MSNYIVLENIPNTPEGRAFLKQLRKYLPHTGNIRARGCHRDRVQLAKTTGRTHKALKQDVPCHLAERLRVYVTQESLPRWLKRKGAGQWYFSVDEKHRVRWFGPFKQRRAAEAARRVSKGI